MSNRSEVSRNVAQTANSGAESTRFHGRVSKVACLIVCGLLFFTLFGPLAPPTLGQLVVIDKGWATPAAKEFDPNNPPEDMPPFNPNEEAGAADDAVEVKHATTTTPVGAKKVKVTKVTVDLSGSTQIWLPNDASAELTEHENGHARLSKWKYDRKAKGKVEKAFEGFIGKEFEGENAADAAANAKKEADELAKRAKDAIMTQLNALSDKYETLTDHGADPDCDTKKGEEEAKAEQEKAEAAVNPPQKPDGKKARAEAGTAKCIMDQWRYYIDGSEAPISIPSDPTDPLVNVGKFQMDTLVLVGREEDGTVLLAGTCLQVVDSATGDTLLNAFVLEAGYMPSSLPGFAGMIQGWLDIPPAWAYRINNTIGSAFLDDLQAASDRGELTMMWFFADQPLFDENGENLVPEDGVSGTLVIGVAPGPIVRIEKTHNTMQGREEEVSITLENTTMGMGGFDFLIAYDASALTFKGADEGELLIDCDWEYFTYRYGPDGNCGDACPSGMIRLVAIADLPNGDLHPSCFGPPDTDPHELAKLRFLVTSDLTFEGQYIPITFYWLDCGDNTVSNVMGDTLFLDRAIYDFEGNIIWNEEDDVQFPESARYANIGAPDSCLVGGGPGKPKPICLIDFWKGGIDIIPIDSIDAKGDINLNGLANEIGDAVLLANYFIYGPSVWDPLYYEAQIAATDVNNDGIVLTVADLVYLVRIITGDAQPFPKVAPQQLPARVDWRTDGDQMVVEFTSQADAGGVLLVFDHQGAQLGEPALTERASALKVLSHDDGTQLRVLLYSSEQGARINAGQGAILTIPVSGSAPGLVLAEAEAADYYGNMMTVEIARPAEIPRDFVLFQNVPNPFNAATRVDFNLPEAGQVSLAVYDVLGRKVATLVDGYLEAGAHYISWDAQDEQGAAVASGMYFCRIIAATHQASRKMVLIR